MNHDRSETINSQSVYLGFLVSVSESFIFDCAAVPLFFHVVPATVGIFVISWDQLFCFLFQSVFGVISRRVTAVSSSRPSSNFWPPIFGFASGNG